MPKKIGKPQYRAARRPHPGRTTGTTVSSPCCVGIDIGSHRSRLCLSANGSEIIVENKHQHNLDNSYPGDFPSSLYVFDDDDNDSAGNDRSAHAGVLYSVERDYPERLSVSAKYVFYALADASDTLLLQYPLVRDIVDRKHDPKFKARLRNAMVALLSVLRERAMPIILNKNWHIAKVGLTIPVQWTLEFEDVYRDLVSEVFEVNPNIIYFFTETEALARYLFKHHASEMDPNEEYNAIMFIDFGGHNMNGCVFGVARDPENPECNSFYRVGRAFGEDNLT
ncbi:hypothetical protein B0T14DRAFT_343124 [Immersiella caudata]|uniref:Uncharacterized protein n=1 Tax=Immersiella caudata TaxID=314043 RepID=A0AA39U6U1_9PEZI|nr:hypothetical protein B0T14DRAFT_343124 [Immersiella caudata]